MRAAGRVRPPPGKRVQTMLVLPVAFRPQLDPVASLQEAEDKRELRPEGLRQPPALRGLAALRPALLVRWQPVARRVRSSPAGGRRAPLLPRVLPGSRMPGAGRAARSAQAVQGERTAARALERLVSRELPARAARHLCWAPGG
jgi:hypothetical protein